MQTDTLERDAMAASKDASVASSRASLRGAENGPASADGAKPPTTSRRPSADIPGWGSDLPHSQRPAVPMERTPPRLESHQQILPEQQTQRVEVLQSKEHFSKPPLHGSTLPPYGINGMLRRAAFKFSENDIRHWLMLLIADRVDMVESLVSDIAQGKPPNLWVESGMPAQWKYDRARVLRKAAVATSIAALTYLYLKRNRR